MCRARMQSTNGSVGGRYFNVNMKRYIALRQNGSPQQYQIDIRYGGRWFINLRFKASVFSYHV